MRHKHWRDGDEIESVADMHDIREQVRWFVRTTLKDPPDTIAQIAAETGLSTDDVRARVASICKALLGHIGRLQ